MSRKNLLTALTEKKLTAVNSPAAEEKLTAVNSGNGPDRPRGKGAFGAMTRSIDELAAKADAAKEIEAKLLEGETVIELDPDLIDHSFISDRMEEDDNAFQGLVEAIRVRGQDLPILVRPHPTIKGRYQIAFGHRRARASKHLGRPVRAVVKSLSDRDHIVAQGQENSARSDLSFIERAVFASKLHEAGYDRETTMLALSVDKTVVSKMHSVTKQIPTEIIQTIGAAQNIGRDRWYDLSLKFRLDQNRSNAAEFVTRQKFLEADSDTRFNLLFDYLPSDLEETASSATSGSAVKTKAWAPKDKCLIATMKNTGTSFTLALKSKNAAAFGEYISENLEAFYEAFTESEKVIETGD